MKLYTDLADWWPLMSSPEDYAEEAQLYREIIHRYRPHAQTALELGSGGGNTAFHLKQHYRMTLTDLSPAMIAVSQQLNPDCAHIVSDMRTVDLQQQFDLVFIHDAIMYLTTEEDLAQVFAVAHRHLAPNGILFIAPDFFWETFRPSTDHGGHDGPNRSMRYLEWTADANPDDHVVEVIYTYVLKDEHGKISVTYDQEQNGLFSQATWERLLQEAGFTTHFEMMDHSELEPDSYIGIVGLKNAR